MTTKLRSPEELLKVMGKGEEPAPVADVDIYCVGFMHNAGARGDKIPIKVFASNDVAASKAAFQEATPVPLKIIAALLCVNGDADVVVKTWNKLFSKAAMEKSPGWFLVSKSDISEFVKSVTINTTFSSVSEAKAKKPKLKGKAVITATTAGMNSEGGSS